MIGSHTRTHRNVGHLVETDFDFELKNSQAHLEEHLGVSVRSFCFPFGTPDSFSMTSLHYVIDRSD